MELVPVVTITIESNMIFKWSFFVINKTKFFGVFLH